MWSDQRLNKKHMIVWDYYHNNYDLILLSQYVYIYKFSTNSIAYS